MRSQYRPLSSLQRYGIAASQLILVDIQTDNAGINIYPKSEILNYEMPSNHRVIASNQI